MSVYESLADKFRLYPNSSPKSPELLEILEAMYSEEEATLAKDLNIFPEKLSMLAKRIGREADDVSTLCEAMADKGLIVGLKAREEGGEPVYSLMPILPGVYEMQFMKEDQSPEKKHLAKLFHNYYKNGWGENSFVSDPPLPRVLAVEAEIPTNQEVLPYDRVSRIIENSSKMALVNCACRVEAGHIGEACDAPVNTCMVFGPFAQNIADRGFGKIVSKEKMHQVLKEAVDAGLVHCTDNMQGHNGFICACCGCCCGILKTITLLDKPAAVAKSGFLAKVDEDLCSACGVCEDRCQIDAITTEDFAVINEDRCIGCMICAPTCPTEAIKAVRRDEPNVPFKNIGELLGKMMANKNKQKTA